MTPEQILVLAPDALSAKSGKELSNARKWVALQSATVVPDAKTWLLRDAHNHALPLAPRFANGDASWKLLALTGGHAAGLLVQF